MATTINLAPPWGIDYDANGDPLRAEDSIVISDNEGGVVCEVPDEPEHTLEALARARVLAMAPTLQEELWSMVRCFDHANEGGALDGGILHEAADRARAILLTLDMPMKGETNG